MSLWELFESMRRLNQLYDKALKGFESVAEEEEFERLKSVHVTTYSLQETPGTSPASTDIKGPNRVDESRR